MARKDLFLIKVPVTFRGTVTVEVPANIPREKRRKAAEAFVQLCVQPGLHEDVNGISDEELKILEGSGVDIQDIDSMGLSMTEFTTAVRKS